MIKKYQTGGIQIPVIPQTQQMQFAPLDFTAIANIGRTKMAMDQLALQQEEMVMRKEMYDRQQAQYERKQAIDELQLTTKMYETIAGFSVLPGEDAEAVRQMFAPVTKLMEDGDYEGAIRGYATIIPDLMPYMHKQKQHEMMVKNRQTMISKMPDDLWMGIINKTDFINGADPIWSEEFLNNNPMFTYDDNGQIKNFRSPLGNIEDKNTIKRYGPTAGIMATEGGATIYIGEEDLTNKAVEDLISSGYLPSSVGKNIEDAENVRKVGNMYYIKYGDPGRRQVGTTQGGVSTEASAEVSGEDFEAYNEPVKEIMNIKKEIVQLKEEKDVIIQQNKDFGLTKDTSTYDKKIKKLEDKQNKKIEEEGNYVVDMDSLGPGKQINLEFNLPLPASSYAERANRKNAKIAITRGKGEKADSYHVEVKIKGRRPNIQVTDYEGVQKILNKYDYHTTKQLDNIVYNSLSTSPTSEDVTYTYEGPEVSISAPRSVAPPEDVIVDPNIPLENQEIIDQRATQGPTTYTATGPEVNISAAPLPPRDVISNSDIPIENEEILDRALALGIDPLELKQVGRVVSKASTQSAIRRDILTPNTGKVPITQKVPIRRSGGETYFPEESIQDINVPLEDQQIEDTLATVPAPEEFIQNVNVPLEEQTIEDVRADVPVVGLEDLSSQSVVKQVVDSLKVSEGEIIHIGSDSHNITLGLGVVPDGGLTLDGKPVTGNDFEAGGGSIPMERLKDVDDSGAYKEIGDKIIRRSNYDSTEEFTVAVVEAIVNMASEALPDFTQQSPDAQAAVVDFAYNVGEYWLSNGTVFPKYYNEIKKPVQDRDYKNVIEILKFHIGQLSNSKEKQPQNGVMIRRIMQTYNPMVPDKYRIYKMKRIGGKNGGIPTYIFYDKEGNVLHKLKSNRPVLDYSNSPDKTYTIPQS